MTTTSKSSVLKAIRNIGLCLILTSTLQACGNYGWYPFLYHPEFSQGNIINPAAVQQLKTGMTKNQTVQLLGTPILETPLSANTWHYVYTYNKSGKVIIRKNLTLYFQENSLARIVNK